MNYSSEALALMTDEVALLRAKYGELMRLFVHRNYNSEHGREMGTQGFMRRIKILVNSVEQVFEWLPPERPRDEIPDDEAVVRAEIAVHAMLINLYGAIDNLAWVWVCEKNVTDQKGQPLRAANVGFWKGNAIVRKSLPTNLQTYLAERNEWLKYVADWRHPLAHRVPPYIPPYCVDPSNEEGYRKLEDKKLKELSAGNWAGYDAVAEEQKQLAFFRPWIQGSFSEGSSPIWVHQQMLVDFNTIYEMGLKVRQALDDME